MEEPYETIVRDLFGGGGACFRLRKHLVEANCGLTYGCTWPVSKASVRGEACFIRRPVGKEEPVGGYAMIWRAIAAWMYSCTIYLGRRPLRSRVRRL